MTAAAFFHAIETADVGAVRDLVGRQPSLLTERIGQDADRMRRGYLGLHLAAHLGHGAIEQALVELGADPNGLNAERRTALHVALEYNNTTVDTLIELGVTVDVCAAASLERMDHLQELLDADPELANDTSTGLPPLGWASYFCALDSARLLLDRGARAGTTALMCAAEVRVRAGRAIVGRTRRGS